MPISKASSNAVAAATKGDLVVGSATNDSGILSVGSANQVLTVDSSTATGLKWATAATPVTTKSYSLLSTTNLSGSASVSITGISGVDDVLVLLQGVGTASNGEIIQIHLNGDTASNYRSYGHSLYPPASYTAGFWNAWNATNETRVSIAGRSSNSGSYVYGALKISGCNTSGIKVYAADGGGNASGGNSQYNISQQGIWNNSSTLSSITVTNDYARNFNAGTVYVYTAV